MGFLEGLAEFGTGATQGVNQGLDLYSKYAQIQEQNKARDKQNKLDQYLQQSVAKGDFNDHAAGLRKYGDYALSLGDADIYSAASKQADALEKVQLHKKGLQAFQVINTGDVKSAIPLLNDFAKSAGLGATYDVRQGPEGKMQLLSTVNGKTIAKNYDDPVALQHDALKLIEPALFDDTGDYLKYGLEKEKTAADVEQSKASATSALAQAARMEAITPSEIMQNKAAAYASGAAAKENLAQAGQVAANAQAERASKGAQADYYRTQTDAQLAQTVREQLGPETADLPGAKFANRDANVITPFASQIMKQNKTDMNTAIAAASTFLDPTTKPSIDPNKGTLTVGDQTFTLGSLGLRLYASALAQNIAAQNAAQQ